MTEEACSWAVHVHTGGTATATIHATFCVAQGQLAGAHAVEASIRYLVVDLRSLVSADKSMREALRAFHNVLHASQVRTAYLAERPSVRGLALWVIHMCGDLKSAAVGSEQQAERWLGTTEDLFEISLSRATRKEVSS